MEVASGLVVDVEPGAVVVEVVDLGLVVDVAGAGFIVDVVSSIGSGNTVTLTVFSIWSKYALT